LHWRQVSADIAGADTFLAPHPMATTFFSTGSLMELEQFIHRTLCEQERLDPVQSTMRRSPLRQQQKIIGLVVRVESSRRQHGHAIWVEREHRILFYNSAGTRFAEVRLAESPAAEEIHSLRAA
jgi:hypothetical protein